MLFRSAQAWAPSRSVTILIPFAAGGATDVMGRLIAQPMSQKLGQIAKLAQLNLALGALAIAAVALWR